MGAAQRVSSSVEEFLFLDCAALLKLTPPAPLIEGMMFEQGIYALVAAPGIGKSFLEQHLAYSVALGRPVHGHATTQGTVVRVLSERICLAPARLRAWAEVHGEPRAASGEDIGVYTTPGSLSLDDPSSVERFVDTLKRRGIRPRLLTLDHLALNMIGLDDSSSMHMGAVMAGVRLLTELLETTVLLLHHPAKAGVTERGSGALRGVVDGLWFLGTDPRERGRLVLTCEKENAGPGFSPQYYRIKPAADGAAFVEVDGPKDAPTRVWTRKAAGVAKPTKSDARPASLVAIQELVGRSPAPMTRAEIEKAVAKDFKHTTVQTRVRELLDSDVLHEHSDGRVWHRPVQATP